MQIAGGFYRRVVKVDNENESYNFLTYSNQMKCIVDEADEDRECQV